jgi:predicted nucleic acid-binding protein
LRSGFLLDTSVLSLLAPGRPQPKNALAAWVRHHGDQLYVSSVTVAEIEQGIHKLRRAGGAERAAALTRWLDALIASGGERILPLDARTARVAGALSDEALAAGRHPGFADVAIAATAVSHDLHLLTCNTKHFAPLKIVFSDPTELLPASP